MHNSKQDQMAATAVAQAPELWQHLSSQPGSSRKQRVALRPVRLASAQAQLTQLTHSAKKITARLASDAALQHSSKTQEPEADASSQAQKAHLHTAAGRQRPRRGEVGCQFRPTYSAGCCRHSSACRLRQGTPWCGTRTQTGTIQAAIRCNADWLWAMQHCFNPKLMRVVLDTRTPSNSQACLELHAHSHQSCLDH